MRFPTTLLVFFRCQLLIQETVLLVTQPDAKNALTATDAIAEEAALRAVLAVLTPGKAVAAHDIYALVAQFRLMTVVHVHAIATLLHSVSVVAVFTK